MLFHLVRCPQYAVHLYALSRRNGTQLGISSEKHRFLNILSHDKREAIIQAEPNVFLSVLTRPLDAFAVKDRNFETCLSEGPFSLGERRTSSSSKRGCGITIV